MTVKLPKVVIIGGGFGGLYLSKALKNSSLEIILIDKSNHHLFQPLLYEVATAALSPGDIALPLREILSKQRNTTVLMGEVTQIDKEKKLLILGSEEKIYYDYLVVAVGSSHSYFGREHWEQFAPGLKTIGNALEIRQQILLSFEKAERLEPLTRDLAKYLNFVVIGGGPTGVEMSGALADIAYKTISQDFRRINPKKCQIYLIEAAPYILPAYPEKLSLQAKRDLEGLGVNVLVGKKVTAINESGVSLDGQFIPSVNVIWAAGNQASPLMKSLTTPLDRQGRAIVEADLSIPGHQELFVIGDAASAVDSKNGTPLPGIAPVAIQEAKYVAKIIHNNLPKADRKPFHYVNKGMMATIGTGRAVAVVGKWQVSGFFAWISWCFLHILFLINFKNRISVMFRWIFLFFTSSRGVRLIYRPIDKELKK